MSVKDPQVFLSLVIPLFLHFPFLGESIFFYSGIPDSVRITRENQRHTQIQIILGQFAYEDLIMNGYEWSLGES